MLPYLRGGYDLHVHSGPDVPERKFDDLEISQRYIENGFRGYCIKSHYFCTAERARLINRIHPGFHAVGAICLNYTVGGLNPCAVETAGRDGAKLVWMPTFDAKNEIEYTFGGCCTYDTMPAWAKLMKEHRQAGLVIEGITVLEENRLSRAAREVIDAAISRNMVICTGHLGKREIVEVVKEAADRGYRKVIVTHPCWCSIGLSKEEQLELSEMGAVMEQCTSNIKPSYGTTWEQMYAAISHVGPSNCIISSDCGNVNKPYPDQSIEEMADHLLGNGFSKDDIKVMLVENTKELIEN